MFSDRLLNVCFAASLVINAAAMLLAGGSDIFGRRNVLSTLSARQIGFYKASPPAEPEPTKRPDPPRTPFRETKNPSPDHTVPSPIAAPPREVKSSQQRTGHSTGRQATRGGGGRPRTLVSTGPGRPGAGVTEDENENAVAPGSGDGGGAGDQPGNGEQNPGPTSPGPPDPGPSGTENTLTPPTGFEPPSSSPGAGPDAPTPGDSPGDEQTAPGGLVADRQEPGLIGDVPRLRLSGGLDLDGLRSTTIVIAFVVDEQGHPTRLKVKQSCGEGEYDRAALAAAERARFLPAVQNGQRREAPWELRFRLRTP